MGDGIGLTDNEWVLMHIIWKKQPCSLREICDEAGRHHEWSRHAVISFLKRMEQKGAISVEDGQKHRIYRAVWDDKSAMRKKFGETLSNVFNNSPLKMFSCLADAREYSDEEIQQMIAILEGKRGSKRAE